MIFGAGCRTPLLRGLRHCALQVFVQRKLITAAMMETWLPTRRPDLTNTAADADEI